MKNSIRYQINWTQRTVTFEAQPHAELRYFMATVSSDVSNDGLTWHIADTINLKKVSRRIMPPSSKDNQS